MVIPWSWHITVTIKLPEWKLQVVSHKRQLDVTTFSVHTQYVFIQIFKEWYTDATKVC